MLYFYSGTPGSGKSLHTARDIYNKLFIKKQPVICNFEINQELYNKKKKKGSFLYLSNSEITPQFLKDYSVENGFYGKEGYCLVVIDECQLIFNPRNWQDKNRMAWIEFFTVHRRYGYNFILISQFDRLVDRQIRSLFEYEVIHRKINNFKFGKFIPVSTFIAVDMWYGIKEKIGSEMFTYSKKYGRLYDTFKNFDK